jgi:hypothetical protein
VNLGLLMREKRTDLLLASVIMVESLPGKESDERNFQIPGDPGSLASTVEGPLAGLFFMSTRGDFRVLSGVGHCVPIGELLEDIERLAMNKISGTPNQFSG